MTKTKISAMIGKRINSALAIELCRTDGDLELHLALEDIFDSPDELISIFKDKTATCVVTGTSGDSVEKVQPNTLASGLKQYGGVVEIPIRQGIV